MKTQLLAAATVLAALSPTATFAQSDDLFTGPYVGVQAGYHDFCCDIKGAFAGGYVGYNMPFGSSVVVGVEANAAAGTKDVSAEYGASAHLGYRLGGNALAYARVGYQEVDFDGAGSDGDVLYGIGAQFAANESTSFRLGVDTIDWDSTRFNAGVSFHF